MRHLAALSVLALSAGVAAAQAPGCVDSDGTTFEHVGHYGGGIVLAWVTSAGETPFTMVAACNARRLVHIEMLPDMPSPDVVPFLTSAKPVTLKQLAQEMSRQGYYVETGQLKRSACVCSAGMLARARVAG